MKRVFALLFFAATFAVAANAQRFGSSTCDLIPGPCMERHARRRYAPVDYVLNNGYGYGPSYGYGYGYGGYYGNGRLGASALVGAASGAIAGGLVAYATTRSNRTTYVTAEPNGGQYYVEPQHRQVAFAVSKPQKALDCRKPSGKRGKNEAACATAEQEMEAIKEETKHQACLDQLATSSWRLRNFSPVAEMHATINNQLMVVCDKQVILRPLQTIRIFEPNDNDQVGGHFFFAHSSGEKMRAEAVVQNVNKPGFTGFVLVVPGAPKGGN